MEEEPRTQRKRVQCRHFARGHCAMGEACGFAHGDAEAEAPAAKRPFVPKQDLGVAAFAAATKGRNKTQLCRHFQRGFCALGPACSFAHGEEELQARSGLAMQPQMQSQDIGAALASGGAGRFKTAICRHYANGLCTKGDQCTFAHGEEERQEYAAMAGVDGGADMNQQMAFGAALAAKQAMLFAMSGGMGLQQADGGAGGDGARGFKTKLCRHFTVGFCNRGAECTYAHGPAELRGDGGGGGAFQAQAMAFGRRKPWAMPGMMALGGFAQAFTGPKRGNFKTTLCRHFERLGVCRLGDNCNFAHGEHELRGASEEVPSNLWEKAAAVPGRRYKSQLCRHFSRGLCALGSACHFAHGEPELVANSPAA